MDAERIVTLTAGERFDDQPWVEAVQLCDDRAHYKVALKNGEERAEFIVGSEFVKEPPSQVEIEARFIEVNETRLRQMQLRRPTNEIGEEDDALHILGSALKRPGSANLLTATHAQELLQLLTSRSGTDLLSAPRVTTKFGQRAVIEIIREFRYAVEWEQNAEHALWIPTAYETRNAGVTLEVEPETGGNGAMTVRLAPQVVNFLGWRDIDTGRRVRSGAAGKCRVQPVFSARKAETTVKLVDGQTILLTQFAETENTQPFASPRSGRRLIVMMTAHLIR
jgi:type II secretory pathway component GspD/PulD (secretin)